MTTLEEILIRLGVDTASVERGMRHANEVVKHGLKEMREGFKEVTNHIGSMFTAGAIIAGIEKVFSKMHQIKIEAENLGASFQFFQGFRNTMEHYGPGEEAGDTALRKLSQNLGELQQGSQKATDAFKRLGISMVEAAGRDTEQMLYLIADRLHEIENPTERVSIAFDIMGKSGGKMAGILSQGAEQLREYIREARKVSDEELRSIEEAHLQIKEAEEFATVGLGKIIAMWSGFWKTVGEISSGMSVDQWKAYRTQELREYVAAWKAAYKSKADAAYEAEQRASEFISKEEKKRIQAIREYAERAAKARTEAELYGNGWQSGDKPFLEEKVKQDTQAIADLKDRINEAAGDEVEQAKLKVELAEKELERLKDEQALRRKNEEIAEKEAEISKGRLEIQRKLTNEIADTQDKLNRHRMAEYMPSMTDLEKAPGPIGNAAREMAWRKAQATAAMAAGRPDIAQQFINSIEGYDVRTGPYIGQGSVGRGTIGGGILGGAPMTHIAGIKDYLSQQGVLPTDQQLIELNNKMAQLLDQARTVGLVVQGKD